MKAMGNGSRNGARWERLYEIASAQEGHFTTAQAAQMGYSPQLLAKHLQSGRIIRVRRGIYRLVHFPAGEQEDLVVAWLWADQAGVFSHETALALHGLSDVLPASAHLTMPQSWRSRRLRIPEGVILHFSELDDSQRTWMGAVRLTTVARTLTDCARDQVAPDLVRDGFEQAVSRGAIERDSVPEVVAYLRRFFSVSPSPSGPGFRSSPGRRRKPE